MMYSPHCQIDFNLRYCFWLRRGFGLPSLFSQPINSSRGTTRLVMPWRSVCRFQVQRGNSACWRLSLLPLVVCLLIQPIPHPLSLFCSLALIKTMLLAQGPTCTLYSCQYQSKLHPSHFSLWPTFHSFITLSYSDRSLPQGSFRLALCMPVDEQISWARHLSQGKPSPAKPFLLLCVRDGISYL